MFALQTATGGARRKACNLLYHTGRSRPARRYSGVRLAGAGRHWRALAMDESTYLNVTTQLAIPRTELSFRASRSGGPGGQHVNTSSTRIELLWDLNGSTVVDEEQRGRLRVKLSARLDSDGRVRVVASDHRSQRQNRLAAEERLASLVRHALVVPKKRRATRPTRAAKERRLSDKKRRGETKRQRRVDDSP